MSKKSLMVVSKTLCVTGFILALMGCASIKQPHLGHLKSTEIETQSCALLYQKMDAVTVQAKVRDKGARQVEGYPYLRVNRFLASFGKQAVHDAALREAWMGQLRELDIKGRAIEISNLPAEVLNEFGYEDKDLLIARFQECGALLLLQDVNHAEAITLMAQRVKVKDDYSTPKRVLGLYAMTRYPFYLGIEDWQERSVETIKLARSGKLESQPVQYYLPPDEGVFSQQEVRDILAQAEKNPLGMIKLSKPEKQKLFQTFAPVYQVETTGEFDRIGTINWADKPSPQLDTSQPTVYTRLEYTRVQQRTLLQLVYVVWMPERPRESAFDLLGGHLDGFVWRVTLAPDGEPILYDSIHPCGCYHMFFTTPRVKPIPAPNPKEEWAFTPLDLPRIMPGERLTLSLQTRTHYLRNVSPSDAGEGVHYRLADYDDLRVLPHPDGATRSMFGPDGLVAGSERRERFLFWPMGIKNAGAMRQAGTQATAFVGRRHFDDADLIDKRFRLLPPSKK